MSINPNSDNLLNISIAIYIFSDQIYFITSITLINFLIIINRLIDGKRC